MKEKKLTKKLLAILLILLSIAIIVIAFIGIYLPNLNKLKNIVPNYKLSAEVDGIIEYRFKVDGSAEEKQVYVDSNGNIRGEVVSNSTDSSEESFVNDTGFNIETRLVKKNEDVALTKENFEKAKSIIEERLKNAGATEFAIRLDNITGNLVVELSQNDDVGYLYQVGLSAIGEFDIIDAQTGVVLLDKTHLKKAGTISNYDQESNSYTIYLQLEFDEAGADLITEISKKYVKYTDSEGNSKTDYISIRVDGASVMKTYFGEPYEQAILNVPIASNISANNLNSYQKSIEDVAFALNQDTIPVKYTQNGSALFIESDLADNTMNIFYWLVIICLVVIFVVFTVKYKVKGALAGILNAALIGLIILVIKYVKVTISISSMVALFGDILLNLVFLNIYLNNLKNNVDGSYMETLKLFYSITFPVIVVAFIFTFFVSATVTGLGSVLFWGMLLQIIYNTFVVKYVLEEK